MIFLSFTEMFTEAYLSLGMPIALTFMGIGLFIAFIIDELLPEQENVHEHLWDNPNSGFDKKHSPDHFNPHKPHDKMFVTLTPGEENKGRYFIPLESPTENIEKPKFYTPFLLGVRNGWKKMKKSSQNGQQHHHYQHQHQHQHQYGQSPNSNTLPDSNGMNPKCEELFCVDNPKLMKLGLFTMLSLLIHNIPEGVATFSASLMDPRLGIQIEIAIMLHNIPEGICVAVPIFMATSDKKKAFWYAAISGLAEPFGAILAWLFLYRIMSDEVLLMVLAVVAGIMIYISVDTLIHTAKSMDYKHTTISGFSVGMILMGISLIFFGN